METSLRQTIINKIKEIDNSFDKIVIEDGIPYDWDDYDLYGCVYLDMNDFKIKTTQYGHGTKLFNGDFGYAIYEDLELPKGVQSGLDWMIKDAVLQWMKDHHSVADVLRSPECLVNLNLCVPCSVNKGRKLKGDNLVLLRVKTIRDYFNRVDYKALVADTKKKICCWISWWYVNPDIDYVENHLFASQVKYEDETSWSMAHLLAYDMSYAAIDRRNYKNKETAILYHAGALSWQMPANLEEFTDPWEEKALAKKRAKAQKTYDEHLPNVQKWAHEKFDNEKTPEEVEEIINKTMKKYYPIP